jgi:predicted DNA-binding protein
MYTTYIVKRTQIYLSEEQGQYLERRSRETGQTVSHLIRTAIDDTYLKRPMDKAERLRIIRATAGAWKDFPYSGAEWVDRIRGRGRLARLHGIKR